MLAVPSDLEGRPIAEPSAPPPPELAAPTRSLSRSVPPQLNAEELAAARKASYMRLFDTWNEISEKYGTIAPEDDDEVDLLTGEITRDRGRIRELKPRAFAEGVNFDFEDDGLEEEDEEVLGDESDASGFPFEEENTPEPDAPTFEEDYPALQDQPWTAEDDRDLREFLYVERMRRRVTGETSQQEAAELEPTDGDGNLEMEMANMDAGQMGLIAKFVRREVERMLGAPRPSPPFPHAAARAAAGRPAPTRPPAHRPNPASRPQPNGSSSRSQSGATKPSSAPARSQANGSSSKTTSKTQSDSTEPSSAPAPPPQTNGSSSKPQPGSLKPSSSLAPRPQPNGLSISQSSSPEPSSTKGPVARLVEQTDSLPQAPAPAQTITNSSSAPNIPSALKTGPASRTARPSLSAPKVRFADKDEDSASETPEIVTQSSKRKGKGRMAGERPGDSEEGPPNQPNEPPRKASRLSEELLSDQDRSRTSQSASASPVGGSQSKNERRRKRRVSAESEADANGIRARFAPTNVYLKSISYHDGKLRECKLCLEAPEPRSRYAAVCRGRIDSEMCRFPDMTPEEVAAAIAYREDEEAAFQASKKRKKLAPNVNEVVTEIPTSWRPRPGDERYSMAPHRVRGGAFKRCKLCVVAGGVREKRSMFCMGRSGYGKCAFETEEPSGSSGDEEETPEQAAIKQMEHRLLRAQNARMNNMARAFNKEETPAAPPRKSTTPYVSYRQGSTRPGLPATRGPAKVLTGEDLNPRAPNGRLKPRCGPCLRAGGERAEKAFLCPGSGRPKYCDYAPGAAAFAARAASNSTELEDMTSEPNGTPAPDVLATEPQAKKLAKGTGSNHESSAKATTESKKATAVSNKVQPTKKPRHRFGEDESSADDYVTEESEFSPEFAESDDSLDSSADEVLYHRIDRTSTGYRINESDEASHDASGEFADESIAESVIDPSLSTVGANERVNAGAEAESEDLNPQTPANESFLDPSLSIMETNGGKDPSAEAQAEDFNAQILADVAASMDANYAPRPASSAYAPYLSFQSGGAKWQTCSLCEDAGGARAEAAMWCYGRDLPSLCRLSPNWTGATAPPALPDDSMGPRSARTDVHVFSPDRGGFSPDRGGFAPEHSPDPLASDIEMDEVMPNGAPEDQGVTPVGAPEDHSVRPIDGPGDHDMSLVGAPEHDVTPAGAPEDHSVQLIDAPQDHDMTLVSAPEVHSQTPVCAPEVHDQTPVCAPEDRDACDDGAEADNELTLDSIPDQVSGVHEDPPPKPIAPRPIARSVSPLGPAWPFKSSSRLVAADPITRPSSLRFTPQPAQYRDPRPFVSSDGAPSPSPPPSRHASPVAPGTGADGIQTTLARSIQRDFLAPPPTSLPPRPQQQT